MRSVDRKLKVQCRCDWKEPKAEREVNKTQRPPSLAGRCRRTSLARFLKATRHQSKVVHFVKTHDFSPIQLPFRDPPRLYIKPLFLILLSGVALSPCEGSPLLPGIFRPLSLWTCRLPVAQSWNGSTETYR